MTTPLLCQRRRRAPSFAVGLLALVALAFLTVACSNDGKTLRAPPPGATAPLRPTSSTAAPGASTTAPLIPGLLSLTSTDFEPSGPLADDATCLGSSRSPTLAWSGLPEGTVEVAIVMTNPDDGLFTNWIVAGLDPGSTVTAGTVPEGAVVARNGNDEATYAPPCPPEGETHLVEFTLYALSAPSGVTADLPAAAVITALDAAPGSRAVVTAMASG